MITIKYERLYVVSDLDRIATIWTAEATGAKGEEQSGVDRQKAIFEIPPGVSKIIIRKGEIGRIERSLKNPMTTDDKYVLVPSTASISLAGESLRAIDVPLLDKYISSKSNTSLLRLGRAHLFCNFVVAVDGHGVDIGALEFSVPNDYREVTYNSSGLLSVPLGECDKHRFLLHITAGKKRSGRGPSVQAHGSNVAYLSDKFAYVPDRELDFTRRFVRVENGSVQLGAEGAQARASAEALAWDWLSRPGGGTGTSSGDLRKYDQTIEVEALGDLTKLEWRSVAIDMDVSTNSFAVVVMHRWLDYTSNGICDRECAEIYCRNSPCVVPVGLLHEPITGQEAIYVDFAANGRQQLLRYTPSVDEVLPRELSINEYRICHPDPESLGPKLQIQTSNGEYYCDSWIEQNEKDARVYCWGLPDGQTVDVRGYRRERAEINGVAIAFRNVDRLYKISMSHDTETGELDNYGVKRLRPVWGAKASGAECAFRDYSFVSWDPVSEVTYGRISDRALNEAEVWTADLINGGQLRSCKAGRVTNGDEIEFTCKEFVER